MKLHKNIIKSLLPLLLITAALYAGSAEGIVEELIVDPEAPYGELLYVRYADEVEIGGKKWACANLSNPYVRDYIFPLLIKSKENQELIKIEFGYERIGDYYRITKIHY